MADLFKGKEILKKVNGELVDEKNPEALLEGKVVLVYFSAHWCPPCRGFTPLLKDFYEEVGPDKIAVIFISFDRAEADFQDYVLKDHGDWLVVSYTNAFGRELASKYSVSGIPFAAVIDRSGKVVVSEVRGAIQRKEKPAMEIYEEWKTASGL